MRGMAGEMPVYPVGVGSYMPHWNEVEEITYQGEKIAFFSAIWICRISKILGLWYRPYGS